MPLRIFFCLLLLPTPGLFAQSLVPRATAQRAIDFATWKHSERVLTEKMAVICQKSKLLPREKNRCAIWTTTLAERLRSVQTPSQTPPSDTLDVLLRPFPATRAEAVAFRTRLTNRLVRHNSVDAEPVLRTVRTRLTGSDTLLIEPIAQFLRAGSVAAVPVPVRSDRPAQRDVVVIAPDTTIWQWSTGLGGLLALLGWTYALRQRRQARAYREKIAQLSRELHEQRTEAWADRLGELRSRGDATTPPRP